MIFVGLGNPGKEYSNTKHNVGFRFIDKLAESFQVTLRVEKNFEALIGSFTYEGVKHYLIKPMTYMNESGRSVRKFLEYYHYSEQELFVIHDDMDLPLFQTRIRKNGSSGGQKGMKSIIENCMSQDIKRLRIGIGRGDSAIDYVLSPFSKAEAAQFEEYLAGVPKMVCDLLLHGVDYMMNNYNG